MGYKVNKIRVGTKIVRPNKYEYSYDFRNKTESQITTDGWTKIFGNLETGSSGITSPSDIDVALSYPIDVSTAKKITLTLNIVWNSDYNSSRAAIFGINDAGATNGVEFYVASTTGYSGTKVRMSGVQGTNIGDIGKSSYSPTLEIDLENKTVTGIISGYNNSVLTLTDSQVSLIKSFAIMTVYTTRHNFYIQNVSITVE